MRLLASMPVCAYVEIAERAQPSLRVVDPAAANCGGEVVGLRETLFLANYGLAKSAAHHRCVHDYSDRLSAASCGLLDAIDRYLPGPRAARFSYFATYWIRYRLGRHAQKQGAIVSFPINQYRISRRIDRFLAEREDRGLPPPSEREIRTELNLGADAYYWHLRRPRMVSLQRPVGVESESFTLEHTLRDPGPQPSDLLDYGELAGQLHTLLRAHLSPEARVVLAYTGGLGSLADAAEDYLAHLQQRGGERLRICRFVARSAQPAAT
jgi:DNA-directed RNA polymerase specialized sigma subunit